MTNARCRSRLTAVPVSVLAFLTGIAVCLTVTGCSHMVETRAITAFTDALDSEDVGKLRASTTDRFSEKALRLDESVDDFSVLRLPTGKIEVVEVDEVSDTEKRVNAQVKGTRKQFRYRLVKDSQTNKWRVDDIFLKQKKDGIVSTKPVTELMDLVTTVREFLNAWASGQRSAMLSVVTDDFAESMQKLPNEYLARAAERVIGDRANDSSFKPDAQMDDDVAVVRLPRRSGQMVISFRRVEGQWRISDLAVESRDDQEHIPSARQYFTVLNAATEFLDAYNANDKERLGAVSAERFFNNSLVPASLEAVKLPESSAVAATHQVRMQNVFAEFLVQQENELIKLSLNRIDGEDSATTTRYAVDDVTIYELDGQEQKRLSAMFLSHAMIEVFSESLALREINAVRQMSSAEFRSRVWNDLQPDEFARLVMPEIETAPVEIESTMFNGPITEVQVKQGSRVLVYVLRDQHGELLIDDVRIPVVGRTTSLKETLELQIPVHRFTEALAAGSIENLQVRSSRELNRLVWHLTDQVPEFGLQPVGHLQAPLTGLSREPEKAVAIFGDDDFGARVVLVQEGTGYVVDDILLVAGPQPQQRIALRDALRTELSRFRQPVSMIDE